MKTLSALFSILVFLFIRATEARENPKICSSSCGDISNISYPFRLKEDPAGCGDPDFELSCQNNTTTFLNFNGGLYKVKSISYDKHVIRVVDVNLANGNCRLPYKELSTEEVLLDPRYAGPVDFDHSYNLHFVHCSDNISNLFNSIVPCLSGNSSLVYVNLTTGSETLYSSDVPNSCKIISAIPATYEKKVQKNPSYETILKMQESGFVMKWSVECRDCVANGRRCSYYYESGKTSSIFMCEEEYDSEDKIYREIYTVLAAMFLLAIICIVRFILLPLVVLAFILHKYFSARKKIDVVENSSRIQQASTPERYTYADILSLSNNFKDKIGQGCFGSVYKGQLPGGCPVAVKILGSSKIDEERFIHEVSTISKIHHPNLVPFMGFCSEGSKFALVYQYMPNGSLDTYVYTKDGNSNSFCWEKLHEIALETAQGIKFLHGMSESHASIVHLDIKPQNILLDQNLTPKIADFCLAKLYPKKHDFMSMCATTETIGYMAPELISSEFGPVSSKSDVYSFGMILLELASRRRHVDVDAINSGKVHFPSWVYELNDRGDLELENYQAKSDAIIARKLFVIGSWCTQTKALDRPSMARVVEMLKGNINDLEMPPKPLFFSPPYLCEIKPESESESLTQRLMPVYMERSS